MYNENMDSKGLLEKDRQAFNDKLGVYRKQNVLKTDLKTEMEIELPIYNK